MIEDVFWRFGLKVSRIDVEVRRQFGQTAGTGTAETSEAQEAAAAFVHHVLDVKNGWKRNKTDLTLNT